MEMRAATGAKRPSSTSRKWWLRCLPYIGMIAGGIMAELRGYSAVGLVLFVLSVLIIFVRADAARGR